MEFIHKYKRIFLLIGMGICIIAMIITLRPEYRPSMIARSLGLLVVPLQSGATAAADWVGSQVSLFWEMRYLQQDNERLREEIGRLEIENQRLQLAGEENRMLLDLLDVRERYGEFPAVGARIIGHDPSPWYFSFTIDRGTRDGVEDNMAVLGPGGMVGRVQRALTTSSNVIGIIDDRFSVSVQSVRTEDIGMIRGDSTLMQQGLVRMDNIDQQAHIMVGDEVVTSILSMFPLGIRVGTIVDVQPTPDGLAQYAIVSPFANVRQLEHVLVVTQLILPEEYDEEMIE